MNQEKQVSEILKRILDVLLTVSEQLTVIRLRTELVERRIVDGGTPKSQNKRGPRDIKKVPPKRTRLKKRSSNHDPGPKASRFKTYVAVL